MTCLQGLSWISRNVSHISYLFTQWKVPHADTVGVKVQVCGNDRGQHWLTCCLAISTYCRKGNDDFQFLMNSILLIKMYLWSGSAGLQNQILFLWRRTWEIECWWSHTLFSYVPFGCQVRIIFLINLEDLFNPLSNGPQVCVWDQLSIQVVSYSGWLSFIQAGSNESLSNLKMSMQNALYLPMYGGVPVLPEFTCTSSSGMDIVFLFHKSIFATLGIELDQNRKQMTSLMLLHKSSLIQVWIDHDVLVRV